ncbi:MAG: LysR family transcriptional regulator [Clostridia bacterium]|nr:LysR family transcriptional regulator [Clostridia bacterium]
MDLRNLNTFIQVAELCSFSRAADKLGYAQPTVSFQIKQLEDELRVQLFDRVGHTIRLTDEGRAMLAYAQNICRMSEEMIKSTSVGTAPEGKIRLAMADSLCSPLIPEKFANFHSLYPHISIKITTAGTGELFRLLDHNEVDIVCTLDNHIYDTSYVICGEEKIGVHFVCSSENPLAKKESIEIEELIEKPFLLTEKGMSYRRLLDEALARRSMEIDPILELGSADIICRLAEENTGIAFLPDYVTEKAVRKNKIARLNIKNFDIELWKQLIYRRDKWVSAQMKAVIDFLKKISIV